MGGEKKIPKDANDDQLPIPKMPTEPPFSPKEATEDDALDAKDPDPYKQRGTYTPDIKAHEQHQAWMLAHPVTENGETRPWDDLNDFENPDHKVARAKQIADDIFELTEQQVAKETAATQLKSKLKAIKKTFKKTNTFMKRIVKASKAADNEESIASQKRQQEAEHAKTDPKVSMQQKIEETMTKEDEELEHKVDNQEPAQWALDIVNKEGLPDGKKKEDSSS